MSKSLPRLINLEENISNTNTYYELIRQMRDQACQINGYWNFDRKLVSHDEARLLCQSDSNIVVSEQWRLIGTFQDLISFAQLVGYTYQPLEINQKLPGYNPEESYWIRSLQIVKLCQTLNQPCKLWQELSTPINKLCCKCPDQRQSHYQIPTSSYSLITVPSFPVTYHAKTIDDTIAPSLQQSQFASTKSPFRKLSTPKPFCQLDPSKSPLPGKLSPIKIQSVEHTPIPGQLTPI